MKTTIMVKRTYRSVIQYDVITQEGNSEPEVHTFHANGTATFYGPHTGKGDGLQVNGPANTAWREKDEDVLAALKRKYRGASVKFTE